MSPFLAYNAAVVYAPPFHVMLQFHFNKETKTVHMMVLCTIQADHECLLPLAPHRVQRLEFSSFDAPAGTRRYLLRQLTLPVNAKLWEENEQRPPSSIRFRRCICFFSPWSYD